MANRQSSSADARRNARLAVTAVSDDLREARIRAGLIQREVGERIGLSQAQVSRLERGDHRSVRLDHLARLAAAVGLQIHIRAYPAGRPIRDRAQLELLAALRRRLAPSWRVDLEVPVTGPGDLRAWDMLVAGAGLRIGVEAVTRVRDIQALVRSVRLKQRDGSVDRVLLVIAATSANRRAVGSIRGLPEIQARTRSVLANLAAGRDPGGLLLLVML